MPRKFIESPNYRQRIAVIVEKASRNKLPAHRRLPPEDALAEPARRLLHNTIYFLQKLFLSLRSFGKGWRPFQVLGGFPVVGDLNQDDVLLVLLRHKDHVLTHLYVIGFAIQANARSLVEKSAEVVGVPATYVQATPDIMMGDLLKNMRSSEIFSVCGLPEVKVRPVKAKTKSEAQRYEVELLGLDVFDPITMEVQHRKGDDVPAWFLDTDYNGLCFHVSQAFFPRTGAWESLKKALRGEYEESVWDHLAGTVSAPFEAGQHGQVAVKVIDDRGNELLVVKPLSEVKG